MPMSPSSKYLGRSAGSILPAFSISADRGRTSSSAKAATASRNIVSSSERRVSADGEAVASAGMSMDSLALYQIRAYEKAKKPGRAVIDDQDSLHVCKMARYPLAD